MKKCTGWVQKNNSSEKTSLTQEHLLLSHRVCATHDQCARVECDQLEGCVSSKGDHFLLCWKCIFWAAVPMPKKKINTDNPDYRGAGSFDLKLDDLHEAYS